MFSVAPKAVWTHLCWSHSAVSCRCIQITISSQNGNHYNQYSAFHYWKYCSVLRSWAFSEGDVVNYWSVTRCHLKSYTMFVRAPLLPVGYMRIYCRRSHQKKTVHFSVSWGGSIFSQHPGSRWSSSDELNWVPCLCQHSSKMFSSSWISLKTSIPMPQTDSWPSLPPPHVSTQAPVLQPSALVSCRICWWVYNQHLQLWWVGPRFQSCCWKINELLHPIIKWNSRAQRPEW